jgi:hypothetical protein
MAISSGDFQKFALSSGSDSDDSGRKRKSSVSQSAKKGGKRKECPGCGAKHAVSVRECSFCDYQFTSKSMLVSSQGMLEESQNIRDRFPFEPERVRYFFSFLSFYHIYS